MKYISSNSIPDSNPDDIIAWADTCGIQVDGHGFDSSLCPQAIEPMRAMMLNNFDTRIGTYIKPVQSGGSTAGEIIIAYWSKFGHGSIQENWQDELKAKERWNDRILPSLKSINLNWSGEPYICEARFSNAILRAQGVFSETALNSDTIVYQKNEEVHLWKKGHLTMARDRQTRVSFPKAFDISNASTVGDQLHSAYQEGTMEEWKIHCLKCGLMHPMKFRFNPNKPELGGLRWDSTGCKLDGGRFNYAKLSETLRYEFPCGHVVRNTPNERRALKGGYSAPIEGSSLSHRSWISEAVSYEQIDWLNLVKEWHGGIRALKHGDQDPMFRFVTRRECQFYSEKSVPYSGQVVLTSGARTNRHGLPNEAAKIWAADWQQGYKSAGELTHYWLVIESVLRNCSSQVLFAGKISDEMELLGVLKDHGITADLGLCDGFIDASKNWKHIASFCYNHEINCVVGGDSGGRGFRWPDGTWQYFKQREPIYKQLNISILDAMRDHPNWFKHTREGVVETAECPCVVRYQKAGLLKNHFFIREMKANTLRNNPQAGPDSYIERIVPEDIGEDYMHHHSSWARDLSAKAQKKLVGIEGFKEIHGQDHLLSCTTYIDLRKDESGWLGERLAELGIKT